MTNKLEILYPLQSDFLKENPKEKPELFNHFSYFQSQIVITKNRDKFSVKCMNFIPSFSSIQLYECAGKSWIEIYKSSNYMNAIYFFQRAVDDCLYYMNKQYLYQYARTKLPHQVVDVMEVFS